MGAQQIVLLPFVAARVPPEEFAHVVLVVTISAVSANIIGGETANTMLIRGAKYSATGKRWDFHKIFILAALVGITINLGVWSIIAPGLVTIVSAVTLSVLSSLRLFLAGPFRLAQQFRVVTSAHVAYVLASFASLPLITYAHLIFAPFLAGEVAAVSVLTASLMRARGRARISRPGTAQSLLVSLRSYLALATAALLSNAVGYMDRIIIAPILSAPALAIYFAASVVPKSVGILINPLIGLLLAKFGSMDDGAAAHVLRRLLRVLPGVAFAGTFIALGAGTLGLSLLYPQYYEEGQRVVAPISISVGLASSAYLLQPFVLRFRPSSLIVLANALQALVFVASALILSHLYGIVGFAWAVALTHLALLGTFILFAQERRSSKRL
ncbi:lipopolysaccharide biosynthesis protein [Ornithinimicrobium sp. W1679]